MDWPGVFPFRSALQGVTRAKFAGTAGTAIQNTSVTTSITTRPSAEAWEG